MKFWDAVREISIRNIRNEANLRFYLGLAGTQEAVARAERVMFGPEVTEEQVRLGREFLEPRTAPFSQEDLDRLAMCQLVLILEQGPALVQIRPAPGLLINHPHDLIPTLLTVKPEWRIALARRFPAFREPVVDRLIFDVSRINAEFSILSALATIPPLTPIFPAAAGASILVLTKNQILLVLRLAAAHGLEIDPKYRFPELLPILGGAFGWRAAAHLLSSVVPGPVGAAIKGTIAFSGTWVTGKAAQHYYRYGHQPSQEQMRRLYEEASERARAVVEGTINRFKRVENEAGTPHRELPPHGEPDAEPEEARSAE